MIKIALKHFIYEKCINVLFDGIVSNFIIPYKFNVGDRFNYMWMRSTHDRYMYYSDVTLVDLRPSEVGQIVGIKYGRAIRFLRRKGEEKMIPKVVQFEGDTFHQGTVIGTGGSASYHVSRIRDYRRF